MTMLTVADMMTREPYTLKPDDTMADARKMMVSITSGTSRF